MTFSGTIPTALPSDTEAFGFTGNETTPGFQGWVDEVIVWADDGVAGNCVPTVSQIENNIMTGDSAGARAFFATCAPLSCPDLNGDGFDDCGGYPDADVNNVSTVTYQSETGSGAGDLP